jgi:hypothetical protein
MRSRQTKTTRLLRMSGALLAGCCALAQLSCGSDKDRNFVADTGASGGSSGDGGSAGSSGGGSGGAGGSTGATAGGEAIWDQNKWDDGSIFGP